METTIEGLKFGRARLERKKMLGVCKHGSRSLSDSSYQGLGFKA